MPPWKTNNHVSIPGVKNIDQAAVVDAFLAKPLFFFIPLKDFSFKILDPIFLLLFLRALSSRRQQIVLPDPGSSASKLAMKS
jgi:hypothetical protein